MPPLASETAWCHVETKGRVYMVLHCLFCNCDTHTGFYNIAHSPWKHYILRLDPAACLLTAQPDGTRTRTRTARHIFIFAHISAFLPLLLVRRIILPSLLPSIFLLHQRYFDVWAPEMVSFVLSERSSLELQYFAASNRMQTFIFYISRC